MDVSQYDTLLKEIQTSLNTLKNLNEQEQIDVIFSTYQGFHDLISYIGNESNQLFLSTLELIKMCIKSIQSLIYYCSKKENDDKLSPLILDFIQSPVFTPKLKTEFASLANSYLYCNFNCSVCIPLSQFPEDFFSNPLFCSAFEKISGLNSIFNILIDDKKSILSHKIVNSICPNLKYYYSDNNTKANEFLSKSIEMLPMVPFENSSAAFKLLFHFTISHKPPVMNFFIVEKFEFVNKYIQSDKKGNLLFIYSLFFDVLNHPEHSEFIKPLSIHLLNLINNSNSCPVVKKNALATFKVFLANFSEELPIDIQLIYSICCHIKPDDIQSILVFLDIIKYISTHFKTNKILLISAIHPFVNKENALKSDISDAFEIIQILNEDFDQCASSFIVPLIKDDTPQELEQMFIKYPTFLNIFPLTIHELPFKQNDVIAFRLFLQSNIYKTKLDAFIKSLMTMLKKDTFLPFILTKVKDLDKNYLDIIFNNAGKACRNEAKLKRTWIDNDIIKIVNDYVANGIIDPLVYFDFIASVSPVKYSPNFDKLIFDFLEDKNYFNQSEEAIQKLAFGKLQSENLENSFLVLPSILYKCGNFSLSSPSDLYLTSKYSIDIWLEKTGKTVDQFPSICQISKRCILPHHFERLFHVLINELDFENFLKFMPDDLDSIPIVEFNRDVKDTFFTIPLRGQHQNNDTSSFTVSFWVYFTDIFDRENQIFALSDYSILIKDQNSFYVRFLNGKNMDQKIGEFKEKTWINFIICYKSTNNSNLNLSLNMNASNQTNELSIYINSALECNFKNSSIPNLITFGSFNENDRSWYIGGYIRVLNDCISKANINSIYNFGVFNPPLHLKNEKPLISVAEINPPIDSNVRLAPSSSFLKYFINSFGSSHNVVSRILKLISQKNERNEMISKKLLYSIIINQSLYRSQKVLSGFILNLSILANLKTNLFDSPEIFDLINKCFVKVKSVNWESFFTFYLDLNFVAKDFIIEKMVKFIEKNLPDFNSNKAKFQDPVFRFCFESICLCSENINFKFVSKLLVHLDPDAKNIIVYLSSLNSFFSFDQQLKENDNLNFLSKDEENTLKIMKNNQFELCKYLINEMNMKINTDFKNLFILDLVPIDYALEFCYILLSIQPKIQRSIDKKKLMSFCLSNVNKMRAWDCAISLLICSPISFEACLRFEYDTLDITVIPLFLIMFGALLSVVHNFDETSKWGKVAFMTITFIESIMENFLHNDQMMFSLMQLAYFNTFVDTECLFPFAPEYAKLEDIANVSVTRSQEYPKGCGSKYEESKLQLLIQKEKFREYVDGVFNNTIQMIPPYLNSEVELDFSSEEDYTCNYEVKWNSLREYVHDSVRSFGFDDVKVDDEYLAKIRVSKITTGVLDLLSKYLFSILEKSMDSDQSTTTTTNENANVNIVNSNSSLASAENMNSASNPSLISFSSNNLTLSGKPTKSDSLFLTYLKSFTLCFVRIHPSHASFISQRIILSLLTECINQNVFSLELIDFACDRAREGWFANQVPPLLSLVISICQITGQSNLPYSVYSLLILCFEIAPFSQFPIYSEIYLTYQKLIFNDFSCRDPNFYQMLIANVIKYNHVVPETFSQIWHLIYLNMTKYQLNLKDKWPGGTYDLNYTYVCLIEKQGFSFLHNKENENDESFKQFLTERKRVIPHFVEEQYYYVTETLKISSNYLYSRSSEFKICIRDMLSVVQTNFLISRVVRDVIRERMRKIALFDFDLFYRIRENYITKYQLFEHGKGKGSSIIVLGNQLFPPKRVEKSVLFVNNSAEIFNQMIPKNIRIEDDDCVIITQPAIRNHLCFDFYPIQNILYSKEQIGILMFSQKLPISPSFLLKSFEILNDPIEFMCDASFLYGIEPLNGTFIKNSNSIFFIEGLKIFSSSQASAATSAYDSIESFSSLSSSSTNIALFKESKNSNDDIKNQKMKWQMKFVNQKSISPFAFNFYMNYFSAGYFGPCSLFCGHPMLKWNISDIVNIVLKSKGKSDNEYEYEFNFICGWSFIIRANLQDIVASLLYTPLPFYSQALSLMKKDVNSVAELWTKGAIDNYTYLCYLNTVSGRSFCTFSNFPVFPQIFSDIEEAKLRDFSKPADQIMISKKSAMNSSSLEEQLFNASFVYSFFKGFDPYRFLMFVILKMKQKQNIHLCIFNLRNSIDTVTSLDNVVPHFYLIPELCKSYSFPKWCCKNSETIDFVFSTQKLLQSDEVSINLSNWIDLTFGYLFNPSEKSGSSIQLFKKPHEKRQIGHQLPTSIIASYLPNALFGKSSSMNFAEKEVMSSLDENVDEGGEKEEGEKGVSKGLFGLHLMTKPENIVVQKLSTQMFKTPIEEFVINDIESTIVSVRPLSVFINPTTFLVVNPTQGCVLRNGSVLISTSFFFTSAVGCSISHDRCILAIASVEGAVSLWKVKYDGSLPVSLSLSTVFQTSSFLDSEIFPGKSSPAPANASGKVNPNDGAASSSKNDVANANKTGKSELNKTNVADVSKSAVNDVNKSNDSDVKGETVNDSSIVADNDVNKSNSGDIKGETVNDSSIVADKDANKSNSGDIDNSTVNDSSIVADKDANKSNSGDIDKSTVNNVNGTAASSVNNDAVSEVNNESGHDVSNSTSKIDKSDFNATETAQSVTRSRSQTEKVPKAKKLIDHSPTAKPTPSRSMSSMSLSSVLSGNTTVRGKVIFSSNHFIAVVPSSETLLRFDIGRNRLVSPIYVGYRISCVTIDELAGQIITCGDSGFTIWTISGGYICTQSCGVGITSIAVANLPIYVKNRFIVTGHSNGFLLFWMFDPKIGITQNLFHKKVSTQPITAITIDASSMRIVVANNDNEVFCIDFSGTEKSPVNSDLAYECPRCHKLFEAKSANNKNNVNTVSKGKVKICSKCHRYFCKECLIALPRRIYQMTSKEYVCEFCASLIQK